MHVNNPSVFHLQTWYTLPFEKETALFTANVPLDKYNVTYIRQLISNIRSTKIEASQPLVANNFTQPADAYGKGTHFILIQSIKHTVYMRFISTKAHGVMDYLMGVLLIASPWLFDFARGGAETWVPVILGAGAIVYSLMTDYELSMSRSISMKTHLTLDLLSGILLAASPWLFGFNDFVYTPHLILGILEIGAALMTEKTPSSAHTSHREQHRAAH
jgi:hypothetical protein